MKNNCGYVFSILFNCCKQKKKLMRNVVLNFIEIAIKDDG